MEFKYIVVGRFNCRWVLGLRGVIHGFDSWDWVYST
jgi:hypothetical protein